jgi:antitoxin VapB
MSLNIKNPEAVRLAHEVAERTGETATGAIAVALRERLERLDAGTASLAHRLLAIGQDCAARLDERTRTVDHGDLLYGEDGLPR